jgi:predicted ArsR family transcriptional regulator
MHPRRDRSLSALTPLADPVRRALYHVVADAGSPVDRDTAAEAAGISRPLAAFHLDKLVAAGLLEAEYRRRGERTGPGAGRPAKFYRRSTGLEVEVSLPPRRYDRVGEILARAIEALQGGDRAVRDQASATGRALASGVRPATVDQVVELLADQGYEPWIGDDGAVRLRNCPYHVLAEHHRDVVCGMNLALLDGVVAGVPERTAVLAPEPGSCCVVLEPTGSAAADEGGVA